MMRTRPMGWTLVEVLVVLAIVAILSAITVPALLVARESARVTSCCNNLRQWGRALVAFDAAHGKLPSSITGVVEGPLLPGPGVRLRNYAIDLLPYFESGVRTYDGTRDFCDPANQLVLQTRFPQFVCPSAPSRQDDMIAPFNLAEVLELSSPSDPALARIVASVEKAYRCDAFCGAPSDYAAMSAVALPLARALHLVSPTETHPYPIGGAFPLPVADWARFRDQAWRMLFQRGAFEFQAALSTSQFSDGLSQTLWIVEDAGRPECWRRGSRNAAGEPLTTGFWGHPQNVVTIGLGWNPTEPVAQRDNSQDLYSFHASGVNVLFGDGRVDALHESIEPRVLVALTTPSGEGAAARTP